MIPVDEGTLVTYALLVVMVAAAAGALLSNPYLRVNFMNRMGLKRRRVVRMHTASGSVDRYVVFDEALASTLGNGLFLNPKDIPLERESNAPIVDFEETNGISVLWGRPVVDARSGKPLDAKALKESIRPLRLYSRLGGSVKIDSRAAQAGYKTFMASETARLFGDVFNKLEKFITWGFYLSVAILLGVAVSWYLQNGALAANHDISVAIANAVVKLGGG